MSSAEDTRRALLPAHLYVHVPLCRQKCSYCDFYSVTPDALDGSPAYLAQLLADQALAWFDRDLEPQPLSSLYIGGGTPTMLGAALPALVAELVDAFGLVSGAEVTVEANPDSIDLTLADALAAAGVTRVSLGVQSFDDDELAVLGRVHDAAEAARAAGEVRAAGLALALDVICGLPDQHPDVWRRTVERAVETGAEHISVYPLSLEAGSALAASVILGDVPEPDADATADAMLAAAAMLSDAGLVRYEIANYARPGYESRHNTAYWTGAPYVGVGPAAHGMLAVGTARAAGFAALPDRTARVRYSVASNLEDGLSRAPRVDVESLNAAQAAREDAMLGMRMTVGIDEALAMRAGVLDALAALASDGLVEHADGRFKTTERGWLLGNEVFGRIWNVESG